MCSAYWNLQATFTCPKCGKVVEDQGIQTHFMGEVGSMLNWYEIGQKVEELKGIERATLSREFIGQCRHCNSYIDLDGRVENEAVVEVWPSEEPNVGTASN